MSQQTICTARSSGAVSRIARRLSSALVGTAALSLLAVSVHAEDAPAASSAALHKRVDYSDLDLSKPADAHLLYARLQRAAADVCGDPGVKDLRAMRWRRKCMKEALASAVIDVDHIAITELYNANNRIKLAAEPAQGTPRS